MKRWSWLSAVVGLVAGLVIGGGAIGIGWSIQASSAAADAAFRECMAGFGLAPGTPTGATVEEMVAAAEICDAR
jgi:hypothetical protein